ncbi:energy-coupling factor transporter transmembrane component T [Olsenella sp. YH-ols2217]|uniref:Energy-coupling factor transporter transmembrane component T n=1 Tax=Kribbibacterium absianum TaxID=3044210 RepID=A0ABT6ZMI2_9ACTN|nr:MULTISPECIES: energy-coupling factor transporter transmembrane component T [unclassified Olsenella]MDJ1122324.1 energy-coupling factor transporter transmembrane component T [Olsenella sp. YH-ols2216]MDJ1130262.1 energy-coupling factor transporter transmembrane component T [Olsenella sp. YH-ols2217]
MSGLVNLGGWATENSFLRRCDPRFKVGCTVAAMVVCFRIASVPGACAALAMVLALCWLGRVRPGRLLAAVWPLLAMLVFVSALNLFVTQTGNLLVQWGPLRITTGGVDTFALYSVRLATLLGFGTLLLATTDPLGLTNALASLLSPLKVLRVLVEQLAMVLALALRFVPTLADELQSVMDAQRCRGASFDRGSPRRRVGALTALAIPVMTGALRHADTLSLALEARAYDPSAPRTRWRAPHPGWRDAALIALTTAFVGVALAWG